MVRPPARHTLIKCDVLLSASQNRFRTQITKRCLGFNDELHGRGQHSDERLIFHHQHLNPEIVCAFLIFNSFRGPPQAYICICLAVTSSRLLGTAGLFLTFYCTDHCELTLTILHLPTFHTQMCRNTGMHNLTESKNS